MRKTVVFVVLILAITAAGAFYLRRHGYLPGPSSVRQPPEVLLRLENVRVAGRSKGKRAWRITAKRADVSRTRVDTTLYDVTDGVIYDNEKPVAKISAGQIIYNDVDRSLAVSGGINVAAKDGTIIRSKEANYDSWRNLLICPGKVTLDTKKSTAEAASLRANLKTNEVDAKGLRMKVALSELQNALGDTESSDKREQ